MVADSHTNGIALSAGKPIGNFSGCLQNESEGPRCEGLQQAIIAVADTGKLRNLGQVPAKQSETMIGGKSAQIANPLDTPFIIR